MGYFKHDSAIVEAGAKIGRETKIWAWAHILNSVVIGEECNICDHTFIENGVVVGDRVTIKCGVYIWDGIDISDDVFIGPNVTFTNDKYPRSKKHLSTYPKTKIKKGASIGANATILPVTIGAYAMVGAGAVITKDVPANAIVVGNPGKIIGYTDIDSIISSEVEGTIATYKSKTGAEIIKVPSFSDMRGDLSVIELNKTLPFAIKRIFYTYNVNSSMIRGEHAHKDCMQFLIAISGSLNVICDNSNDREEYLLNNPQNGLLIPAGCWGVQYKHSSDCVLLVCASHEYDPKDYIRDYNDFIEYKSE